MSLNEVWEAAAGNPFHPTISKDRQFLVGFTLLLTGKTPSDCLDGGKGKGAERIHIAFLLTGLFGLSNGNQRAVHLDFKLIRSRSVFQEHSITWCSCLLGIWVCSPSSKPYDLALTCLQLRSGIHDLCSGCLRLKEISIPFARLELSAMYTT